MGTAATFLCRTAIWGSSEGDGCCEGSNSCGKCGSSREGDVEGEGSGFSTVVDLNLVLTLFESDNVADLGTWVLNAKIRRVIENDSGNTSGSVNFHKALTT